MFVRWKSRVLRHQSWRRSWRAFYAVLVESHRVNGKIRQKVLAHLAHIREEHIDAIAHQEYFWRRVDWRLDEMQVAPEVRRQVEQKLAARVPRPLFAKGSAEWNAYQQTEQMLYQVRLYRHHPGDPDPVGPTREEVLAVMAKHKKKAEEVASEASVMVPTKTADSAV